MKTRLTWLLGLVLTLSGSLGCTSTGRQQSDSASLPQARASEAERQISLARLMERNGNESQAAQMYRSILEQHPRNGTAHHRLAVIAASQQQMDVAMQHFAAAESLLPKDAGLLADIGYAHLVMNDMAGAEQKLRQALSFNPQHAGARNNLGLVLGYQGKWKDSLREFQIATGSDAEALTNLAFVQSQTGELQLAKANYHRALELDPSLRSAAEALLQITAPAAKIHQGPPDTASISVENVAPIMSRDVGKASPVEVRPVMSTEVPNAPNEVRTAVHTEPAPERSPAAKQKSLQPEKGWYSISG